MHGGLPHPINWPLLPRTSAVDITLTDADEPMQFIRPTAPITVALPAITARTPFFYFMNAEGTTGGDFSFEVIESVDGLNADKFAPSEGGWIWHDGTTWISERWGPAFGECMFHFGGNIGTSTLFMVPHGQDGQTAGSGTGVPQTENVTPFNMRVKNFGNVGSIAAPSGWVMSDRDGTGTLGYQPRTSLSTEHGAGLRSRIGAANPRIHHFIGLNVHRLNTNDNSNASLLNFTARALEKPTSYPLYIFGADLTTTTRFAVANGAGADAQTVGGGTLPHEDHTVHKAGNLVDVYFHVTSSGATMGVLVNGAEVGTVVLGSTFGKETISGGPHAISAGDTIAIRYNSGTNPLDGVYELGVDYDGKVMFFGGDVDALGDRLAVNFISTLSISATLTVGRSFIIPEYLEMQILSWNIESPGAGRTVEVLKNEVQVETFDLATAQGTTAFTDILRHCNPGDLVSIKDVGSTVPDNSVFAIYAR